MSIDLMTIQKFNLRIQQPVSGSTTLFFMALYLSDRWMSGSICCSTCHGTSSSGIMSILTPFSIHFRAIDLYNFYACSISGGFGSSTTLKIFHYLIAEKSWSMVLLEEIPKMLLEILIAAFTHGLSTNHHLG